MITKSEAELLIKNDTFIKVFDIIKQEQVDRFLNSGKDDIDSREEAHDILLALKYIENRLKRSITNEAIKERKG